MPGLQDLFEDYKNLRGRQEWNVGRQMDHMHPQMEQAMNLFGGFDTGGLAGAIKAYHASPNLTPFSKFSKKFLGTGEGAQEFGVGHYFSEKPSNVNEYFPYGSITPYPHTTPQHSIYEVSLEWPDVAKELATPLTKEDFFQWNLPLEKQPEHVQQAIIKSLEDMLPHWAEEYYKSPKKLMTEFHGRYEPRLHEMGVPGVAFKKGGRGPVNYSVFSDDIPRIVSHNKPSIVDLLMKKR